MWLSYLSVIAVNFKHGDLTFVSKCNITSIGFSRAVNCHCRTTIWDYECQCFINKFPNDLPLLSPWPSKLPVHNLCPHSFLKTLDAFQKCGSRITDWDIISTFCASKTNCRIFKTKMMSWKSPLENCVFRPLIHPVIPPTCVLESNIERINFTISGKWFLPNDLDIE